MKFLDARKLVAADPGGEPLPFLLAMSGTPDTLELYIRAHAVVQRRSALPRTLSFNTLPQTLLSPARPGEREVFVLLPWDLVPELDWRSGLPDRPVLFDDLCDAARQRLAQASARPNAALLYLPAPVPPVLGHAPDDRRLYHALTTLAGDGGAICLAPELFSLPAYLAHGTPFSGANLSPVAQAIVAAALDRPAVPRKVLVTDLDQTLWRGVVGEDGVDRVDASPQGVSYRHFVYQTQLAALQRRGALLAAVSRNDPDLARGPLERGTMVLGVDQFVAVSANYHAKSGQISALAESLDLGLESFVFVDDNPVELEEVAHALPQVACVAFPAADEALPEFLDRLSALFPSGQATREDRQRTEMYRARLAGMVPKDLAGADVTAFLRNLDMALEIHDRTAAQRERAVQLINKTNQFNLNGRRWSDVEVEQALAAGGRLYTASLSDRHGSHGEILSCLVTRDGEIQALVMSCRVLQRRVEHAFLAWLLGAIRAPLRLSFEPTERNTPLRLFLGELGALSDPASAAAGTVEISRDSKLDENLGLFSLRVC